MANVSVVCDKTTASKIIQFSLQSNLGSHLLAWQGDSKFFGASLALGHAHFFLSGCDFMVGLAKPQLQAKFEVDSVSHCTNIKGGPQTFRDLP